MNLDPADLRSERALPNAECEEQISLSSPYSSLHYPIEESPPSFPPSMNQGQPEPLSALHTLIISLITTVGGYVLFQYQSKRLSLFDEHGSIMRAVFMVLFLYVIGLMAEFKLKRQNNYLPIVKLLTPLVGLSVVVLLLFILSLGLGLAASVIWALLAVEPTIILLQGTVQWFHGWIIHFHGLIMYFCGTILHFWSPTMTSNFDMGERDSHGTQANVLPV